MASSAFCDRFPRTASVLGFAKRRRKPLTALFVLTMHTIGFVQSISAVMETRTPQGAIAWAISLNTFPYIAVPAYAVFGDNGFESYISTRTAGLAETRPFAEQLIKNIDESNVSPDETTDLMTTVSRISSLPVTSGNRPELLVDGKSTFRSIFDAIDQAEDYILVQFYIIRTDGTGIDLKDRLIKKAREGVKVYLLYDDYGSLGLEGEFTRDLQEAGVRVQSFMNLGGEANRFQLNFRNHRKIVVVDGKVAFVGGHNVGDEYLGKHPSLTPWRDSHLRISGPVVASVQIPFVEDWHWATGELLDNLKWDIETRPGNAEAVCIPTGPADPMETCSMFFQAAIHAAKNRVWIATPYFVPDEAVVMALQLAARRGVEVKVLIPELSDSKLVYMSSFSYLKDLEQCGVEVWRYQKGFLHQKVMMIDDEFSMIGSANLDNRSFRLNFEAMIGVNDPIFASEVKAMMQTDFDNSIQAKSGDLASRDFKFRLGVKVARLLAPIQ